MFGGGPGLSALKRSPSLAFLLFIFNRLRDNEVGVNRVCITREMMTVFFFCFLARYFLLSSEEELLTPRPHPHWALRRWVLYLSIYLVAISLSRLFFTGARQRTVINCFWPQESRVAAGPPGATHLTTRPRLDSMTSLCAAHSLMK